MMRIVQTLGLLVAVCAGVGCHGCDTCLDVGGPCGLYNLAGRDLPPPLVPDVVKDKDKDDKKGDARTGGSRPARQTAGNRPFGPWR